MPLSKETKDRISGEADNISRIPDIQQGYQMGAEAEAERAQGIVEALKKVRKYFPDTTAHAQDIDKALAKYHNPK